MMQGIVIEYLKLIGKRSGITFKFETSGLEDVTDRVQGFEAGDVDFISKPFQEAEILARVRSHLQLRYMQLHLEDLVAERTADLVAANKKICEARNYLEKFYSF